MENTWGLRIAKIDEVNDEFIELIALNLNNEKNARDTFNKIKNEFNSEKYNCVVDLLDENDDIIDDYGITEQQAYNIIGLLGHTVSN